MAEPSDTFYIIEEGTVSVEASFVDIPLAQRAVTFPVNVALPNNGWCAFLHANRFLRDMASRAGFSEGLQRAVSGLALHCRDVAISRLQQ